MQALVRPWFVVVIGLLFTLQTLTADLAYAAPSPEPDSSAQVQTAPDEPAMADDEVAAAQERVDLRTEASRTFENPDGTFTSELYSVPIHYRPEADGDWQPIDIGFEAIDGARPESDLVAESTKSRVQVSVGANERTDGFLVLEADDRTYAISLTAADAARASFRSPTFEDGRAEWVSFLPGVDLRVLAGATGVKTFLIVHAEPATPEWRFVIDAPGLTAELADDGSVGLFDADKQQVARIPAPYAVDSSESEERGGGEMSDQVSLAVRTVGDRIELTVRADPGWLAGATYPVFVDPSLYYPSSTSYGDAFVSTKYPTMNFADYVRPDSPYYHEHWLGMDPTDSSNVNKVLMRFDVSALDDVTIDLAQLKVHPYHQYYNAPTATTTWVNRVTGSWAENTVTENNQPGSSCPCTSAGLVEGTTGNLSLTGLVQDWADGTYTNYGVKLHENGNNGTYWKRLISYEQGGSNRPVLEVTWHRPVGTPSNPTAAEWTSSRALSWNYSDSEGAGQTHYQVQVDNNSDFSSVLSSSGTVSSSSHSWSIPTGVSLTNGTTYYWRVKVKNGTGWSNWSSGASFKWDAASASFTSSSVSGAVTAADPNYYELGSGSVAITIRGSDANSGIRFTYLRLYNATDEMRVKHDWQTGGTHCDELNTSTLVDATACAETYNSGGTREVTFTVAGLNQNASFDIQWYFTDYAGNTVGYTDTGNNLILDATAPTGAITSPAVSATVGGTVNVVGTASDANFHQYTLEYGAGASPSSWSAIGTNPRTSPVTNDTLGSWDTSALSMGTYTIRLRVYDKARVSSGFTTVTRTVTVDNSVPVATIASPTADRLFDQTIPISGTADGDGSFTNYTLHYGVGCSSPSTWIPIGSNPYSTPVENGTLGTWDTAGLVGPHTLRLVANRSPGGPTTATVCVELGSSLGQQPQHRFETWDLGAGDSAVVNAATGNLVLSHPLVSLPYRGGNALPLTLTYNSLATDDVGLGTGWQLDVQARLVVHANGSVTYVAADGSRHLFSDPQTAGSITSYARPDSLYAILEQDATPSPDVFSLTWRDGRIDTFEELGNIGRLDRSEDRFGNGLDFGYDGGTGLLETITDPASRVVDLAWNGSNQLESVTDWAYIDGSGVVQATASGSRRIYRFFYGSGQLIGWSDPLNTVGSCPTGGSHLTCLTYTDDLLSEVTKTQTVTTFTSGTLGTTTRQITTEFTYDDGRMATVTDAEQVNLAGPATTFTWEEPDRVVVARPTTTTAYELTAAGDPFGRVTSVMRYLDPGTPIEQRTTWDAEFPIEPASVTDNYGAALSTPARTVSYEYVSASLGLLEKLVEPLTATTDERWTEYTYNANHDVTEVIVSAEGSSTERTVTRYCYSSAASCPSANGLTMLGEIQGYVDGTGGTGAGLDDADTDVRTDYAYDANGQRTSVTRHNRDSAAAVLDDREDRFSYDANGNLTDEIVNYANGTVTGGDDLTPNATTRARTDLTTTHTYDTAGNRISTADARRAILAATGSPGADDFVTRWTHDALDRQMSQETPTTPGLSSTQATASTTFDELGLVRSATDFGGLVAATEFDRSGRPMRTFEDLPSAPAVVASEATYDADGKLLTAEDRRQVADSGLGYTTYGYDGLGRQTDVVAATGTADESTATTGYDALDRRASYDVGGQLTTYGHDLGGRVVETDDGFTCATGEFDYRDLATEAISGLDGGCGSGAEQRTIQHTHDALGRAVYSEVTAGVGDGDVPLDDAYDAVGNRLSAAVNGETPTVSTLNLLDQVVAEARTDGSTVKTTYDPAGNPVDVCSWAAGATVSACLTAGDHPWTNPATQVTSSTFDARNQRVSLEDPTAGSVTTFDPDHNYAVAAVFRELGSGREHQTLFAYDARHRLEDITFQTCAANSAHACTDTPVDVGSVSYEHDDNSNRTRVSEDNASASSDLFYCYDARNQLVGRNAGSACSLSVTDEAWTYDPAGNRLTATAGSATTNFAYDGDGALCDVETAPTAASCSGGNVTHDSGGRIAELEGWFFGYDAEGRLTSACKSATCASGYDKVTMAYDADGRRTELVTTTAASVTTTTTFRYANGVLAEEAVDGTPVRRYVTDASGSISKLVVLSGADAGTYLVSWNGHGDALNLLRVNGDGSTALANSFTYDTWGTPTTATHNGIGNLAFRYLYVGQHGVAWDDAFDLGLHLMGVRHYSPALGRFVQPDPAALELNAFAYARSSPLSLIDPCGTFAMCWDEITYCALPWNVHVCSMGVVFASIAIDWTKRLFPTNRKDGSRANAFQHCFWIAMFANAFGRTVAKEYGDKHESCAPRNEYRTMDLHNNGVGRSIGVAYGASKLRDQCMLALKYGKLKVVPGR